MYKDKFILSVIHNGSPVRESGSRHNRQVAVPFGSEYKIRLKNKNDRSCAVRLSIDGSPVSNFGDFVVNAGGVVDLERFVTDSINRGKRFKFVTLDHKGVDDPTRSDNGIIRAEFRLAKAANGIKITPSGLDNTDWWYHETGDDIDSDKSGSSASWSNSSTWTSSTKSRRMDMSKTLSDSNQVMYSASMSPMGACAAPAAKTEVGATVQGSHSSQSFGYTNLEVEDHATILQLKMVGIRQPQSNRSTTKRFCTQCGGRLRKRDKYCGGCGRRI